jgi:titin
VFIDDGNSGSFVEANSDNDAGVRDIPSLNELMITRIAALGEGKRFRMYVTVFNDVGSTNSPIVSTILATVPDAPPVPTIVDYLSDDTKITIDISAFPTSSNGGSEVTSFEIQWATGQTGPFSSLVGASSPFTASTYTKSTGITKGQTYRFKYRAKNVHGFGSFSPILEVIAATVPQAPSRPDLVSVTSSTISLKFKATEDNGGVLVSDYELWIDQGSAGSTFIQLTNYVYSAEGFTYDVDVATETLTVGLFYRFKYLAVNSKGESEFSNALTVPLADVPAQPSSLSLTALTKTSVQAEWVASTGTGTPAGDIKGYMVYRDDGLSGSFTLIYNGSNIATVRSVVSTSLVTGYYYMFKHEAVNSAGSSLASTETGIYACIAPSGMAAPVLGTITETQVEIFWSAPTDNGGCAVEGYELYVTNLARSAYNEVHSAEVNDIPSLRTFNITELPTGVEGQKMNIQVKVKNEAGLYAESDILEVTVAGVPSKPTSGPSEDTSTTSNSVIGVTYTAPDDGGATILSYEVQIDDGEEGDFTTFAGGSSKNYVSLRAQASSGIVEGMTYRVRYRARNVNGWGEYSDSTYILAASVPEAPTKPLYISSTDTSIELGLSPSVDNNGAPITSHKLYRDAGSLTSSFTEVTGYDGSSLTYNVTGLTLGTMYRFYYTALNSKGESDPSGESRYTAGSPPSAPTDLQVSSTTSSSITLVWTKDASSSLPITGFVVEINDGTSTPSGRVLSDSAITGTWVEVYDGRGKPDTTSVTISELEPGKLYRFRYISYDANGASDYSSISQFYSCTDPSQPGTPVVTENTLSSMTVSWEAPSDDGSCEITEYALYRNDGAGGAVDTQIHSTELSGHPELTQIEVTEFPSSPVGLSFKFKVIVYTDHATGGVESEESAAYLLAIVPDDPTVAPTNGSDTSASQIQVVMAEVTTTNGADILSYHLQIDDGDGGDFVTVSGLTSDDTSLSRTITGGIQTGALYRARYRARNSVGYTGYSPIGYIEASQIPDTPGVPTVTKSGSDVIISWTLPYNQGNDISMVQVYIQNSALDFILDETAQSSNSVTIPMSEFNTTYGLSQGDDIIAKFRVWNDNGWSGLSETSATGVLVEREPATPPIAPASAYSPLATGNADYGTRMIISVQELTGDDTGGSAITSYQVEYDSSGSGDWVVLGGESPESLTTTYTVTGLTNGNSYNVRYRAKNVHGWGEYSSSTSILVAEVPQKIDPAPTTTLSSDQVLIVWTKPADGGSTILGYNVEFVDSTGSLVTLTD